VSIIPHAKCEIFEQFLKAKIVGETALQCKNFFNGFCVNALAAFKGNIYQKHLCTVPICELSYPTTTK
jgi:hypothetical protein